MFHTYFSDKKTAEASAKLLVEEWHEEQTVKEFLHTRAIALEKQQFLAAKAHIQAQLSKGLKGGHYEILRREILSTKSELNLKTTIATWGQHVGELLGEAICASKKVGPSKPTNVAGATRSERGEETRHGQTGGKETQIATSRRRGQML